MRTYLLLLLSLLYLKSQAQIAADFAPVIINQNGKYGILDEDGKTVVLPIYDTVIASFKDYTKYAVPRINPVFYIKKNGKYAFAYNLNLDTTMAHLDFPKEDWKWYVSEFKFDSIVEFSYEKQLYYHPLESYGFQPFYILKYKTNGKWGLIYFPAISTVSKYSMAFVSVPAYLGSCRITEARFDSIGKYNSDGFYDVLVNGKWRLLEVLNTPPSFYVNEKDDKVWVDKLYPEVFDTIPTLLSYEKDRQIPYFRRVKIDGKRTIVRLNSEKMLIENVFDKTCDRLLSYYKSESEKSIPYVSKIQMVCQNYADSTIDLYIKPTYPIWEEGFYLKLENIHMRVYYLDNYVELDTIINKIDEIHREFIILMLIPKPDSSIKSVSLSYCVVDAKSKEKKYFISSDSVQYDVFPSTTGIVISKNTITKTGVVLEFYDFLSESKKLTLKWPHNKLESLKILKDFARPSYSNPESHSNYLIIQTQIKGKEPKDIYYYDYTQKKFFKGKCKPCKLR